MPKWKEFSWWIAFSENLPKYKNVVNTYKYWLLHFYPNLAKDYVELYENFNRP